MLFRRLERLDHLAKKFRHKCDLHEQWSSEITEALKDKNFSKYRLDEVRVSFCFKAFTFASFSFNKHIIGSLCLQFQPTMDLLSKACPSLSLNQALMDLPKDFF